MTLTTSGGALVIASVENLTALRDEGALKGCEAARFLALPADEPLPAQAIQGSAVVVLEVDPASEGSLQRLARARVEHPGVSLIVALRDASVALVRTLIRQGVADVAQLPFQPETLAAQILDALSAQTERVSTGHLAPMIAVVGATGGAGATTALTHIANALAEANTGMRGVCLIDLDLQGGDVASYLGATPKVTIDELLDAGSRMDADLFRSAVVEARRGLSLVAAPPDIKPMDRVDTDDLLALVKLARSLFDYVLVDLPPVWNSWSLSVVNSADRVVLVSDASINCLRQAKRRMRLFDEIDFPSAKVDVVINRMERKLFRPVSEDAMADALGVSIAGTLPLDGQGISAAQDEGRLVTENGSKSRYGSQTDALAHAIVQRLQGE
ncbi:MAG: CpaE family protein, partial [Tsuneonella sp.]